VELTLAAVGTSHLRLGPGVTNPVTRHLAVTASAAATLQAESAVRAMLGFARGDSALSQIGRRRQSVSEFERSLEMLQALLRGEEIELGGVGSAIRWLSGAELQKVPVHVAASGPRVIEAAARHAEGVDLTVGAELERLRWGVETARSVGLAGLSLGAYVNVAVAVDRQRARELVRGSVSTFGRFASEGVPVTGLSDVTATGIKRLARGYERDRHGAADSAHAQQLDDEFIDRFAVAGPPEEVSERLTEIGDAGIERLIVVPGSLDAAPADVEHSNALFVEGVLPELAR
jgi:5,10-methylenetetrahydromethanopterin reductase